MNITLIIITTIEEAITTDEGHSPIRVVVTFYGVKSISKINIIDYFEAVTHDHSNGIVETTVLVYCVCY